MKKTKIVSMVLFIGAVFLLSSCASVSNTKGYATSLEEAHPDRIEKTVVGMSTDEFKAVWPEATRAGISEDGEAYEFVYTHLVYGGYAYDYRIYTRFYFTNNKLVKYESNKASGLS